MNKAIFIFFFLLTGCQTTIPTPYDLAPELSKSNGYVHAEYENQFIKKLEVRNTKTNKKYKLTPHLVEDESPVGAWLPEGTYKLTKWHKYNLKGYENFTVKKGHVTSLGTFFRFDIGNEEFVLFPRSHNKIKNNLEKLTSKLSAHLISTTPIIFENSKVPSSIMETPDPSGGGILVDLLIQFERSGLYRIPISDMYRKITSPDEFFNFALSNSKPTVSQPAEDASGSLYYGAELGQIRVREPSGIWKTISTGSLNDILAMGYFKNNLIAGDNKGNIKISADKGKTWSNLGKIKPEEIIVDIDTSSDYWFLTTQKTSVAPYNITHLKEVNVYSSKTLSFNVNKPIKRIPRDFKNPALSPVKAVIAEDKFFLGAYPNLFIYDIPQGSWQTILTPSVVNNFSVNSDGKVLTILKYVGSWSYAHSSNDLGVSWTEKIPVPWLTKDVMFDQKSAMLIKLVIPAQIYGPDLQEHQIMSMSDDSKSWSDEAEQVRCFRILNDKFMKPKFCVSNHGSILRYDGKWVPELIIN